MANEKLPALFDDRFLESFTGGSIISDPKVAIIELIANSWDAAATNIEITWPENDEDMFSIRDNGHGMTESEFEKRFRKLAYNRSKEQGEYAIIPNDHKLIIGKRPAFGKHGKGRLGGFAFGDNFIVATWKNGKEIVVKVSKSEALDNPISFQKQGTTRNREGHGTEISVKYAVKPRLTAEEARREIGMRFLTDPNFKVKLNNVEISFADIPVDNISTMELDVKNVGKIKITVIDVQTTDRTTQQHGIAWHVKRRLVGECTWRGSGSEHLLDGRRIAAKRYIFIVEADCLGNSVAPDWLSFINSDEKWKLASVAVYEKIKEYLLSLTKEHREESFRAIETATKPILKKLGIVSREKWEHFIIDVQEDCPSISQEDLEKLGALLAKLENSQSKYSLINILANSSGEDLDNLNELLNKWDIDFAKIVLDEIEYRTTLLQKLQSKVLINLTDEVHDLQPLFHRGLWIFGPEYETIEYTSNQGMTKVIQNLFGEKEDVLGSRKRPDFAIIPDGTVGLYSLPRFGDEGNEVGIERLTIVELKKPGIPIGDEQKGQAWKYVKELYDKGYLGSFSQVTCFVLGSEIDPSANGERTEKDGKVIIKPLIYDIVMRRAQSRLLNLYDKVNKAPFLEDKRIRQYMLEKSEKDLF